LAWANGASWGRREIGKHENKNKNIGTYLEGIGREENKK
jgi:hypothetical protein